MIKIIVGVEFCTLPEYSTMDSVVFGSGKNKMILKTSRKWLDQYRVGEVEIDRQHENLFHLVDIVHKVVGDKWESELERLATLRNVLNELRSYAQKHFSAEEKLMVDSSYIDFVEHKKMHERFLGALEKYSRAFAEGKLSISTLLTFLERWLENHVCGADQEFSKHLKKWKSQKKELL